MGDGLRNDCLFMPVALMKLRRTRAANQLTAVPTQALGRGDTAPNQLGLRPPGLRAGAHEFPVPTLNAAPYGVAAGPDGNVWFTEEIVSKVGRITPTGAITEFPIPQPFDFPHVIAAGPDGNLWFTQTNSKVGRITPAGSITEFMLPSFHEGFGIVAGPDGNLWFTEMGLTFQIGRITTAGVITEFPLPPGAGRPRTITAGPDGNLWFTEDSGNKIGQITTAGVITEFPLPFADSEPWTITAGPDGNLWFTENVGNRIGRITTAGSITEFPLPRFGAPEGITTGPDGNLWFTNWDSIGRITPTGSITEFTIPGDYRGPAHITTGPDGNLWFTESFANKIGRITLSDSTSQSFFTVTPCRVADTRNSPGPSGGPALGANTIRTFPVAGLCGIPSGAKAVAVNVTVVDETDLGDLRLFPGGSFVPSSSTINFVSDKVRANNAVIPLSAGGEISVRCDMPSGSTGQTHFLFDVTGYFE